TPALSGRVLVRPNSGKRLVGATFDVELVIAARAQFVSAQAVVTVSPNMVVQSVSDPPSTHGPCNFTTYALRPSPANPSFSGSFEDGQGAMECTVYTMTLRVISSGNGVIQLSGESISAAADGHELFGGAANGTYTLYGAVAPDSPSPERSSPTAGFSVL